MRLSIESFVYLPDSIYPSQKQRLYATYEFERYRPATHGLT